VCRACGKRGADVRPGPSLASPKTFTASSTCAISAPASQRKEPSTLALLPDVNGKDVLDAGCGHGWYADWLARKGARIVAVDRSRKWLPWHANAWENERA